MSGVFSIIFSFIFRLTALPKIFYEYSLHGIFGYDKIQQSYKTSLLKDVSSVTQSEVAFANINYGMNGYT